MPDFHTLRHQCVSGMKKAFARAGEGFLMCLGAWGAFAG